MSYEKCGRPTRSGAACRQQIWNGGGTRPKVTACAQHATDEERAEVEKNLVIWEQGYEAGRAAVQNEENSRLAIARDQIDRLNARIDRLAAKADERVRRYQDSLGQLVTVEGYAYRWTGSRPLVVGDKVELPPNWLTDLRGDEGPFYGLVTQLGSTYTGAHANIIRVAD